MKTKSKGNAKRRAPVVEALEPRILLSADLPGFDILVGDPHDTSASEVDQLIEMAIAGSDSADAVRPSQTSPAGDAGLDAQAGELPHQELRVVDASVSDFDVVAVDAAASLADRGPDGRSFAVHHLGVESRDDAHVLSSRVVSLAFAAEDTAAQDFDIVLVDRTLMDHQLLADAASQDAHVIQYDGDTESSASVLGRVVNYATTTDQSVHSLSVMAHGREGAFKLGNSWIDAGDLSARTEAWQPLDAVMHDGGNLYLFGCNVASDAEVGQALLDGLAAVTGADAFASKDLTGAGGDWELEVASSGAEDELRRGLDTPFDTAALADYGATLVDYNETAWSGSQVFTDGPISFTLDVAGGGAIDWSYNGTTDTLTISDNDGTSSSTSVTITDNNGGLNVGNITVDSDLGTLTTNVDIGGTLTVQNTAHIDNVVVNSGTGTINTVHFNGFGAENLGTVNIDANVTTLSTAGSVDLASGTDLTVTGNVGTISGIDSLDNGAAITVNGDLGTMSVGWIWGGALTVDGNAGTVTVSNDFQSTSTITIGGTATDFNFNGAMDGSVDITGDLVDMDVAWTWSGALTLGGNAGTVTVSNNFQSAGTVDITGNVISVDFQSSLDGTVTVGGNAGTIACGWTGSGDVTVDGDLDDFTSSNNYTGTLTAKAVDGDLTIVDDSFSDTITYPAGTLVVYQGATNSMSQVYEVTSTADDGSPGTLRWAINQANASVGLPDAITFNISGPGVHTILVGNIPDGNNGALPDITDAVIIDGTTDGDYSNTPVIRIDGASAGASVDGLYIANGADNSVIRGLMLTNFSGDGIHVQSGADGITIAGNWIGTSGTGTTGVGNGDDGIDLRGANATIGGTGVNDGNVITNAGDEGIDIVGSGVTNHVVQGNIIGLDPDGATGSGNADVGIAIISGSGNTIGGTVEAARNIISNNREGIEINTDDNVIQGNYIGTDGTGMLDRGNRSDDGVEIQSGGTNNLIGGTVIGAGNVISGNDGAGVYVNGESTDGNIIQGNYIGVNAAGDAELGNDSDGITIDGGADNTTIGGTGTDDGNWIAGSGGDGIEIVGISSGTVIQGNRIGTDATGTADWGSYNPGINIEGGAFDNLIGGTAAGAGNIIAYNGNNPGNPAGISP